MPQTQDTATGWVCTDCTMVLANGPDSIDWSEEDRDRHLSAMDHGMQGCTDVTLGFGRDEHYIDCDALETGGDCECEIDSFSWSHCDLCHSRAGGYRHAVTFWFEGDDA